VLVPESFGILFDAVLLNLPLQLVLIVNFFVEVAHIVAIAPHFAFEDLDPADLAPAEGRVEGLEGLSEALLLVLARLEGTALLGRVDGGKVGRLVDWGLVPGLED
jgi:hypothetical protein